MRTFNEFVSGNNLAVFLVENQIDPVWFCGKVVELAKNDSLNEEAVMNELWRNVLGGISNAARGLAGLGNVATAPAKAAGGFIKDKAVQAGQAIAQGAKAAGQYVGDTYTQGSQGEALKQANNAIQGLHDMLAKIGFTQEELTQALQPLIDKVKEHSIANQERGYRVAPQPTPTPSQPRLATTAPARSRRPAPGTSDYYAQQLGKISA